MRLIKNNNDEFKKESKAKLIYNRCQIYSQVGFFTEKISK